MRNCFIQFHQLHIARQIIFCRLISVDGTALLHDIIETQEGVRKVVGLYT